MQQATEQRDPPDEPLISVLDRLPIAALYLDGDLVRLNSAAEELTGYRRHEIFYDKEWFETLYAKSMGDATVGLAGGPHEELIARKDGSIRFVECLAQEGSDTVILLHDVTFSRQRGAVASARQEATPTVAVPAALLDLVCIISIDGRFKKLHGAWEEFLGYGSGELLNRSFTDIIHPNDLEATLCAFELLVQNDPPRNICNRLRRKDRSYRWVEWRFLPPDGDADIYAALHDITTQKELEQTLRSREQIFRGLFHNAPVGIYQSDADGKHFIANQRWYEYAGLSADEMNPHGPGFSASEEDRERISTMWKNALESGKEWSSEYSYRTGDGRRVWVHGTALQLLDEDGQLIGYLGCNIDITERKLAEEALRKEHELLNLITETSPVGILFVELSGQVLFANRRLEEITGFSREELRAQGIALLQERIASQRLDPLASDLLPSQRTIATGEAQRDFCINFERKDGRHVLLSINSAPFLDPDGKIGGVVETVEDVTERKEVEQRISDNQWLLQESQRIAQLGSFVYDVCADSWCSSRKLDDILGIGPEYQKNLQGYLAIVHPDFRLKFHSGFLHSIRSGERFELEHKIVRICDGEERWVAGFVEPVANGSGSVLRVVATFQDITERRANEEAIRRLNEELDLRVIERTNQLNLAKREMESFSYSVSHDLRAPLRHINSYCTILAEDFSDELPLKAHYYLERICAASTRMGKLIDDLLKLSRINRAEMKQGPFKISKIAQEVADALRETYAGRDVQFTIAEGLTAKGDRFLVRQVLENLMENAMKYTSRQPRARIEFGRTMIDGRQAFFVKDDGAGFDMAYADKLFQPFQRLHGAEFEGTGIGLATVKRIVERHGGRVWANGAVDQGAAFYFTLSGNSRGTGGGDRAGESAAA